MFNFNENNSNHPKYAVSASSEQQWTGMTVGPPSPYHFESNRRNIFTLN